MQKNENKDKTKVIIIDREELKKKKGEIETEPIAIPIDENVSTIIANIIKDLRAE
ncbi:hypothetical protein RJG79_10610 [Mycoplasmatota bacterium WC44]